MQTHINHQMHTNDYKELLLGPSDDYNELINMVVQSGAEQVYTIHGFVDEFAEDLRKRDISAQPLLVNSLDDFIS